MLLFDRLVMTDPERSVEMARELAASLVPTAEPVVPEHVLPEHVRPELQVAWISLPADEVGGDFYDRLPGPDGAVYAVIGDVSGAGPLTALFMTMTTCLFRILAQDALPPGAMLAQANRILHPHLARRRMLITAQIACYRPATRALALASAGHLWPYFMTKEGARELAFEGVPLGTLADTEYPERSHDVTPGDRLVMYTDGIVECTDGSGEMFGFERLAGALAGDTAAALVAALIERFTRFIGEAPRRDDVSVVALAWS